MTGGGAVPPVGGRARGAVVGGGSGCGGRDRGEGAGLPEQQDLFEAAEDAREDGGDHGVHGGGQHSACPGGGEVAQGGALVGQGGWLD